MNWLTVAVLGAIAGWFEFNYQRSRRRKKHETPPLPAPNATAEAVRVEEPGMQPSIAPGAEVDKKLSTRV